MRRPEWGLVLIISLAGACGDTASSNVQAGHLEAHWSGADTGQISGPATAEWCEDRRLLQIRAIRGDTGFALALHPPGILTVDTYPVVAASGSDSATPSARVALRWFGSTSVNGFQGDSGAVVLDNADSGELSGSVAARARSVANAERLTVTAAFRKLTVVPESRGCADEPAPMDPDDDGEMGDPDEVD